MRLFWQKIANMRIFEDEEGKMNLSIKDVEAAHWLFRSLRFWRTVKRQSAFFIQAAEPQMAKRLYEEFIVLMRKENIVVEEGIFAADMKVHIANDVGNHCA